MGEKSNIDTLAREGYPISSQCFSNSIGHHNLTTTAKTVVVFCRWKEEDFFELITFVVLLDCFLNFAQNGNSDNNNNNNNNNFKKLKMNPKLNMMCFLAQFVFFASSCLSLNSYDKGKKTSDNDLGGN